jgi:uncharacterized protein (TIGR02145 family)
MSLLLLIPVQESRADGFVIKSELKHLPTDISAVQFKKTDDNGDVCAIIKVKTDLTDLRFFANNNVVDKERRGQEYWVYVSEGEKRLRIDKLGFIPLDIDLNIPIESSNVYEIVVTSEQSAIPRTIDDYASSGKVSFTIETQPPGAHVIMEGIDMGQTPFFSTFKPGWLRYRLEHPLYMDVVDSILIDPTPPRPWKVYTLTPTFGWVSIVSEPESGASIEINGSNTDYLTPRSRIRLPRGRHNIVISKEKYLDYIVEVDIQPGETIEVSARMIREFSYVQIETEPNDAELWIDNRIIVSGRFEGHIQKGSHTIKAVRPHFHTEEHFLNLGKDDNKPDPIKIVLKPQKGNLSVFTFPEAILIFDGKEYTTPVSFYDIKAGNYVVELRKDGYASQTRQITIKQGVTEYLIDTLRNSVDIVLGTTPSGAEVFIDGKHVGYSPLNIPIQIGYHDLQILKTGYFGKKESILVETARDTFHYDLMSQEVCPTRFVHEGDTYGGIIIGRICWMTENLNTGLMTGGRVLMSDNDLVEKYCYDDDPKACDLYGGLYTWDEAMAYGSRGAQGICPDGWHIPTDFEWMNLESIADSESIKTTNNWYEMGWRGSQAGPNLRLWGYWPRETSTFNTLRFSAKPGGYIIASPNRTHLPFASGKEAFFWTSTASEPGSAWFRSLSHKQSGVNRRTIEKSKAYSVRCVRNMPDGYLP